MLQNKIFLNYYKEVLITFITILVSLSIIAWTVRAVNFLDLIVENGYSLITYFKYSILNIFGIITKFIPLSFLLALTMFILKQIQENEFTILWTSGVKKIQIVHLFIIISITATIFNILISALIAPSLLNQSRQLLSEENFNSFLPTVKVQDFNDSFSGITFFVEEKYSNELKNIFLRDDNNIFKNISSNQKNTSSKTIVAKEGLIINEKMILLNGQIISSNLENTKNTIVKFDQLEINLKYLQNRTIKQPKVQETSTFTLIKCGNNNFFNKKDCKSNFTGEILPSINRRISMPFFLPALALICSLLLIKNKKNIFFNKISIFSYSFILLLFGELIIRFTGINKIFNYIFLLTPICVSIIIYLFLKYKFINETSD